VIGSDGNEERRLAGGVFPTWALDGSAVLFTAGRAGRSDLYALPLDGEGEPRLLIERVVYAAWSPDATRLALVAYEDHPGGQQRYSLDLMRPDGSDRRRLLP
jgi:Tol biopolymer transport system component